MGSATDLHVRKCELPMKESTLRSPTTRKAYEDGSLDTARDGASFIAGSKLMPAPLNRIPVGLGRQCFSVVLVCLIVHRVACAQNQVHHHRPELHRFPPVEVYQSPTDVFPATAFGSQLPWGEELLPSEWANGFPGLGQYSVPGWIDTASVPRANARCDAQRLLSEYAPRITEQRVSQVEAPEANLPSVVDTWWDEPVREPSAPALHVSLDQLIEGSLHHSSFVKMVSTEPWIRRSSIAEECAAFDWRGFLETTYTDTNEPVGNELTTGTTDDRYKDRNWSTVGGVRQDNRLGGNLEFYQQFGNQQNNSRFLLPNPQATSQLELRYTQPLLNGAGCAYNESRIVLARIHANMSSDELIEKLQDHLYKVTEAYWELYRARAEYFQRLKLVNSAQKTLEILEGRSELDAVQRQVLRARAAVATRQSEMARAYTSIRNAESRLRFLVNDPALLHASGQELAPVESPLVEAVPLQMEQSLYTALQHRPNISQAIREVRAATVRLDVAHHEILPKLDLVASTYVAGLAANSYFGQSWGSQFDSGRPTFSAGLLFEVPFGRREAFAKENRRKWELKRVFSQFRLTVEETLTGVELAVREVETAYREMAGKYHAMVAVTNEADYLFDRWENLPGVDDSAVLLLENLLDAQERVSDEEAATVQAMVSYAMSFVQLKREMGTLLTVSPFLEDRVAPMAPGGHQQPTEALDGAPLDPPVIESPSQASIPRRIPNW